MYAIREIYGDRYFAGWNINFAHEPITWNKMNEGYICCWLRKSMAIEYIKNYHNWFKDGFYKVVKI